MPLAVELEAVDGRLHRAARDLASRPVLRGARPAQAFQTHGICFVRFRRKSDGHLGFFLRRFNENATLHPCPPPRAGISLIECSPVIQNREREAAMNRRHFGLSIATAIFLTRQLREAIAQDAGQSSSSVDTDSARRVRDAAGAFLESLDEAARKAVSFPLEADQRTSWSNLPVAIVPRIGLSVGALGVESRRRLHDLLRASTSSQGYHKIAALMRHDDVLRAEELEYLQHNPPRRGLDAARSRAWDRQTIGLQSSASRCAARPGLGCSQAIISAQPSPVPTAGSL